MPGNLYFLPENDIIHLLRLDYIGIPGMVLNCLGADHAGAVLCLTDLCILIYNILNKTAGR